MPELAEVEYYRTQWNAGLGTNVTRVHLNRGKRVFRGTREEDFEQLVGKKLKSSESGGKQMLFQFSGGWWVGIHLGMTGKLKTVTKYEPEKHDHLVLFQKDRALVFTDMRQFGRVLLHHGDSAPDWWTGIGPAITSARFTLSTMGDFLERHKRLAIKPVLLLQKGFPGVGNWMADEILWRAGINPHRKAASLTASQLKRLWREVRFVSREALKKIGKDFSDPPASWLFHERWKKVGHCPKHESPLRRETIGGRTTAWCSKCQD